MEGACASAGNKAADFKRILVAGNPDVGKTSLIKAFLELNGTPYNRRIFTDFATCDIDVDDSKFTIKIHELLCLEDRFIKGKLLEKADVIILCYAVSDVMSFLKVTGPWVNYFKRVNPTAQRVLVATKGELKTHFHAIARDRGEVAARNTNAYEFFECSAYTGVNVKEVFVSAVRATLQK